MDDQPTVYFYAGMGHVSSPPQVMLEVDYEGDFDEEGGCPTGGTAVNFLNVGTARRVAQELLAAAEQAEAAIRAAAEMQARLDPMHGRGREIRRDPAQWSRQTTRILDGVESPAWLAAQAGHLADEDDRQ